jgi:hypothetical protein
MSARHRQFPSPARALLSVIRGMKTPIWRVGVLAACPLVLHACNAIFGVEEKSYSPHDAGPSTNSEGSCDGGLACAPAVPAGWTGPVVLATSADCGSNWPSQVESLHGGSVTAGAVTCDGCKCSGVDAGTCAGTLQLWSATGCTGTPSTYSSDAGCQKASASAQSGRLTSAPVLATHGSCTPSGGGIPSQPAPVWTEDAFLCVPASDSGACASGLCVPTPGNFTGPCIYADATNEPDCPATGYTAKQPPLYRSVTDTRNCNCSCTTPAEDCSGFRELVDLDSGTCNSSLADFNFDAGCLPFNKSDFVQSVGFKAAATHGICQPQAQPDGTVVPSGPVTVCCVPP